MPVERIGTDNVDLLTVRAAELDGSIIDGRGGEDILELAAGSFGVFDFRSVASFAGIERIRGIGSSQSVIFSSDQISGITSFENPNGVSFILGIEGVSVDFRSKDVETGVAVEILTDGATFTVNDIHVASMVRGFDVVDEMLVVEGRELTAAERRTLHSQGIDRVQDATGVITEDLIIPSISGVSSRFTASPGHRVHLAAQASLSEDIGLSYMSVSLDRPFWSQEELFVDQSGAVRIVTDEWGRQRIAINERVVAQAFLTPSFLNFHFDPEATVADVQEILRSIVYESSGAAMPALPNRLTINLVDLAQNTSQAEIGIDYTNQAPTEISLSGTSIPSNYDGDWDSFVSAKDPNDGETFTFTLLDDANGQFALHEGGLGALLILAKPVGQQEDFKVTIRVTDHGGLHFDKTFVLSVFNVDQDVGLDDFIQGTSANDRLTGSEAENEIFGYNGNDILIGNGGNDALYGGLGRDTLTGGAGADDFTFDTKVASKRNANIDRIMDFEPKHDRIVLDTYVFTKLMYTGRLSKKEFWGGLKAHDANDRIIYHKTTGNLFYDPDGSGKKAAIKIAVLHSKIKMTHHDFFLI